MANVMFKKGLLANLPSTFAEGTFYVTTDERAIYLDVNDSARIRLGDFQEFDTVAALEANTNPSTSALYYVKDINCLAKWNGTQYVQINRDTGMTSIEVTGDGNAITAAVYDAEGRKLVLTKGATYATAAFVGAIPEGYTETTIVGYINKKAEETLAAAQGGSSETAASVKAQLDTYKAENNAAVEAAQNQADKGVADAATAQAAAEAAQTTADEAKTAATTAQTEVDAVEVRVDALEEDTHTHENKEVLDGITSAKVAAWDAAEANAKAVAEEVQDNLDAEIARATAAEQANASAAEAAQATADEAKAAIDAFLKEADATETAVDTLKEIQAELTADDEGAAAMLASINKNTADIATLNGDGEGSVTKAIADAIAAENLDQYATNADLTAEADRAKAAEATNAEAAAAAKTAADEAKAAATAAETNAKAYTDDEIADATEEITGKIATAKSEAIADAKTAADAADATILENAKAYTDKKVATAVANAEAADTEVLTEAKAYADEKVAAAVLTWGSF